MILIDYRKGSNELIEPLQNIGLPAERATLPVGDIQFVSHENDSLSIGIEFKKLPDLVDSLRTGRLIETQAARMLGPQGAFDYAWILIEGEWSVSTSGQVVIPKWRKKKRIYLPLQGMMASEMQKRLLTLEIEGGFHVKWTNYRRDTLAFIQHIYRWWTDKPLADHTTLLTPHATPGFIPISDFRAIVKDRFPGVGLRASLAVEKHFSGSLRRACNASSQEWATIEVETKSGKKRLGNKTAERIVEFINGKKET